MVVCHLHIWAVVHQCIHFLSDGGGGAGGPIHSFINNNPTRNLLTAPAGGDCCFNHSEPFLRASRHVEFLSVRLSVCFFCTWNQEPFQEQQLTDEHSGKHVFFFLFFFKLLAVSRGFVSDPVCRSYGSSFSWQPAQW